MKPIAISIALVALVWAVFGQTFHHQFVNYDDPLYVLENPHINRGLSWDGVEWAFTHVHSQNWHPLTSISHMLDCQIFGLQAGWHHAVNVLLHSVAAVLLFFFLRNATANLWASAFVAALFAIHPLRVESVAWIAERKDVLSGMFFMLTLLAYARYTRARSRLRYVILSALLVCGLLSKPMLVTTPFVLLLLDYWPLARGKNVEKRWRRLFLEKLPLFALSAAAIIATFWAQNFALGSAENLPVSWRINNALVSYVVYIGQTFWPNDLIPFYVHPEGRLPIWQLIGAIVVLGAITAGVFARRKQNPYLLTGWLWYLVMLVPVIGIVQVGLQGHADRYTYLPQIGLYIAIVWLVRDLTWLWLRRELVLAPAGFVAIGALSILSFKQTAHWRDTEALWSHTLRITPDSDVAHTGLAGVLFVRGRVDEAIEHYRRAIELRSGNSGAQDGLAIALAQQNKIDEAIEHWKIALDLQPDNIRASNDLALAFVHRGEYGNAIAQWKNTLRFEPNDGNAGANLAWLLATCSDRELRDPPLALNLAQKVNQLADGKNPLVLRTLAVAFAANGRFEDAIATAKNGARLAETAGDTSTATDLGRYIDMFKQGQSP